MEIDDHQAECNPAQLVVDLSHYCGDEDDRPELSRPFSRGDYTYATNGHICVRIPRRADVPEIEGTPDASKLSELFASSNGVRYRGLIIDLRRGVPSMLRTRTAARLPRL